MVSTNGWTRRRLSIDPLSTTPPAALWTPITPSSHLDLLLPLQPLLPLLGQPGLALLGGLVAVLLLARLLCARIYLNDGGRLSMRPCERAYECCILPTRALT